MGDYESWGIDGAFDGEKSEEKTLTEEFRDDDLADAWDEGFAAAVDFRAKQDALPETEIDKPVNPYDKEIVEKHRYATGGPIFDPSEWSTLKRAQTFWNKYGSSNPADYSYLLPADSTTDAPAEEPDYAPRQFWDISTEEDKDIASFMVALGKTENEDTWIKKPDFIQTWDVQKKRKGTAHYVKELDEFIEVRLYDDADGQTWVQWWN